LEKEEESNIYKDHDNKLLIRTYTCLFGYNPKCRISCKYKVSKWKKNGSKSLRKLLYY